MKAKAKDPEDSIGHPDMLDRHPLIVHAAHIHHGRAVFRDMPNIRVTTMLRALAHDLRLLQEPHRLTQHNPKMRPAHLSAAINYAAEVLEGVSDLPPEVLAHLQGVVKRTKR